MIVNKAQAASLQLKNFDPVAGPAEDFIYLCAKFCDALDDFPAYGELRRRADGFKQLTGPGSTFHDLRRELSGLCAGEPRSADEAATERSVWSPIYPTLASLRETYGERFLALDATPASAPKNIPRPSLPAGAQNQRALLRWWCVGPGTVHEAEWVRCNLHTMFAATECAVQSKFEFHPLEINEALLRFRDQLWRVWRQADREHLLGSYLLTACQDAVNAGLGQCETFLENLSELDFQARAVAAAAQDLCHYVEVSDKGGKEAAALEAPAKPQSPDPIGEVTASFVGKCCVLRVADHPPFILTEDETVLFVPFVALIAAQASLGVVTWESIRDSIDAKESEWCIKQHPRAAKGFSALNKRLKEWGAPPDKEEWIGTKKGKQGGRYLNRSVKWLVDGENELVRALARKSTSVSGPTIDPRTVGESTPDREHKLPARPRRKPSHMRDEDDRE